LPQIGLKVIEDGIILRSQASLVASRQAKWVRWNAIRPRVVLDRIAAQKRARAVREVRTRFAACDDALLAQAKQRFGVEAPFGGPTFGHAHAALPPQYVHALASLLREQGADHVSVMQPEYVFSAATRFTPSSKRTLTLRFNRGSDYSAGRKRCCVYAVVVPSRTSTSPRR
jgi:hypothetical protein